MPKRITNNTIILFRDGKRVKVQPNRIIDLTDEELADIKASNPDAVRMPNDESANVKVADVPKPKGKGADKSATKPADKAADNEL